MSVLLEFSMSPFDKGESLGEYVARSLDIVDKSGLPYRLTPMGTVIEGEWDEVMAAVKRCHEVVHAMGAPRITTSIRLGTRTDREQTMQDKIDSVERALDRAASGPGA